VLNLNKKKKYRALDSFQETRINENYENISFTVILISPESSGNIGAITRVMKNFNFNNLTIFNPLEDIDKIFSHETHGFAMHGKEVLLNAEVISFEKQEQHIGKLKEYLKSYDLIIASTAKGKSYTNIKRLAIFPEELRIPAPEKSMNIAILFGKESRGLTNEEISLADILIRIPTSNEYPTLNLSHACGIILYEIFKKITIVNIGRGKHPVLLADREDRLILYEFIDKLIQKLKIRNYKEKNVYHAFKNIFERSIMSRKELSLIIGLFSKLASILNNIELYEN
jgi:TrmH family RNA methyltransferase